MGDSIAYKETLFYFNYFFNLIIMVQEYKNIQFLISTLTFT